MILCFGSQPMTVKQHDYVVPTYNEISSCLWWNYSYQVILDNYFTSCDIINTLKNFLRFLRGKVQSNNKLLHG